MHLTRLLLVPLFVFGLSVARSRDARAQDPQPPAAPPPAATPPAEEPDERGPAGERSGEPRFTDANADRVILFSTAETHPKGTFYFSDHELVLLQFGYALTDDLSLAISGVPPILKDQPYFFDIAAKLNVYRGDVFRAAVIGAIDALLLPKSTPSNIVGLRAGGVGQFCFDHLCRHSLSLNASTLVNNQSNEILPVLMSAGLVVSASPLVKLLVEPSYALAIGKGNVDGPKGFLASYGLRLSGKHFGVDIAFIKPVGAGVDDITVLGLPWVAFTYRSDGDDRAAPKPAAPSPSPM